MIAPKSLKTDEAVDCMENGFGNPTEHASGGLVFESMELLKHYFHGQTYFHTRANYDVNEDAKEITGFKNQLRACHIKAECDKYGAFQIDMYNHDCGYTTNNSAWQCYQLYLNMEGK